MICGNCSKEVKGDPNFCNFCGSEFLRVQEREAAKISKSDKVGIKKGKAAPKFLFGLLGLLILYIIFSDKPFSFLIPENSIPQSVIASSVVNIYCESIDGEASGGSGTIISTEGTVITNSHVIPQNDESLLTSDDGCVVILPDAQTGEPKDMYWAKPLVYPGLSDDYDLAYLEIYDVFVDEDGVAQGSYPNTFPSIFAKEHKYDDVCQFRSRNKLGDSVRIFGYPETNGGFYLTVTDGLISSFSDEGVILTSAKIDSGNSGGLAVDSRGCMVGIPVAVSEGTYQNLGVIIPTDWVLEFFEKLSNVTSE